MSHSWSNHTTNFDLHRNQIPCNISSNQNTKAYLNPQNVNYELIKRTLSKSCLPGGGKIHVNPNFRGNGLSNLSKENHLRMVNAISPKDIVLPQPGTSNIVKENVNLFSNKCERSVNCNMAVPVQSRFKKVNTVNIQNKKSLYSWSKSSNSSNLLTSVSNDKKVPAINNVKPTLGKPNNYKYNRLLYVSPKKKWHISNSTCQPEKNQTIYKSKTKIINKPKTKLLNIASSSTKSGFKERVNSPVKKQLNLSKFVYHKSKKSSVLMVAKAVRNKYMSLNNLEQFKRSKYKIDKRNKLPEPVKRKLHTKKIKDIRKLFPSYFYNRIKPSSYNIYNLTNHKTVSKSIHSWRKNQPSDKATKKIVNNKFPNTKVVKIGGILYKSTANKLTLASQKVNSSANKTVNNDSKGKKNYVLYVRGEKFILENNGKALRRSSQDASNEKTLLLTPKRIDIGGVTYMQKSKNVLIRTNAHQARFLMNKAKNKSIAVLTNLHKRSSMPCMIYHRFGRCIRHNEGLCMYKHDPKNISVCKKFLKGNCTNNKCLLSHQVVQEKMATCHFFLNGLCVRENCPFLHVKLNKNAAICENFLQGFCKLGKECTKRHLHQCPKFDKNGSCDLGSKCPYPHKKFKKTEESSETLDKRKEESETVQYYVHSDIQREEKKVKKGITKVKNSAIGKVQKKKLKKKTLNSLNSDSPDQSISTIKCFPKRIKLEKLPCFIPLNSDL